MEVSKILQKVKANEMSIGEAETLLQPRQPEDGIWVLETNVDDAGGELLGFAMEELLESGAKDVCFIPAFMKKNRPAYILQVICSGADIERMEEIIFMQTTSIGIRRYQVMRTVLDRRSENRITPYGAVKVKCCSYKDKEFIYPEYESVRLLSKTTGVDFKTIFQAAKASEVSNQ